MADFIEDMSTKTQQINVKEPNPVNNENLMTEEPDSQGANFAAMFSQEIIQQEREKEVMGSSNEGEHSWFENDK